MGVELTLFLALGFVAIVAAAGMIIAKNAVHSALFLILNFGCVALLFLMLDAPFLSMVQITVYTGAIMVLFLFVIMLLGAEQTTDTSSRNFGWISGAATVLAASFLFALAIPFVLGGGVDLPTARGADPLLRIVHTANVESPVTVAITGADADEAAFVGELAYGDVTDFMTVAEGAYQVTITAEDTTLYDDTIDLSNDQVATVTAIGDATLETSTFDLLVIPNSFEASGQDVARLVVINAYSQEPILLVNTGLNRRFNVDDTNITDPVLVGSDEPYEGLAYGTVAAPITLDEGRHDLIFTRLLNDEYIEVAEIEGYEVVSGTERTLLLVPDYAAPRDIDGTYRARVIYRNSGELALATSEAFGSPADIGQQLFTAYLLPVNLVGFLLLVGLIGVIVLTRPEALSPEHRRSTRNRRRKVSRPLANVISQQTGRDVIVDTPKLDDGSGE